MQILPCCNKNAHVLYVCFLAGESPSCCSSQSIIIPTIVELVIGTVIISLLFVIILQLCIKKRREKATLQADRDEYPLVKVELEQTAAEI